jgi:hypothetical protein
MLHMKIRAAASRGILKRSRSDTSGRARNLSRTKKQRILSSIFLHTRRRFLISEMAFLPLPALIVF